MNATAWNERLAHCASVAFVWKYKLSSFYTAKQLHVVIVCAILNFTLSDILFPVVIFVKDFEGLSNFFSIGNGFSCIVLFAGLVDYVYGVV